MYLKHHTRGIVISGRIEGDSNKLLSVFTEDFGLISAKVQGTRNIRSKLRSASQDFSLGEFSLVCGKSGWKVVSIRPEKNFFESLRNFPARLKMAGNVLALIKSLIAEEEDHTPLFDVTVNFFNFLEMAKEQDVALAECLTLLRILHILGYMKHDPELLVPLSSSEIEIKDLETIAPRRARVISLINESLKAT